MHLASQASQLSLALAANSLSSGMMRFTFSVTLFFKYGHFCFQKKQDGDGQNQNWRLQNSSPQTGWHHNYLYTLWQKRSMLEMFSWRLDCSVIYGQDWSFERELNFIRYNFVLQLDILCQRSVSWWSLHTICDLDNTVETFFLGSNCVFLHIHNAYQFKNITVLEFQLILMHLPLITQ